MKKELVRHTNLTAETSLGDEVYGHYFSITEVSSQDGSSQTVNVPHEYIDLVIEWLEAAKSELDKA